MVSFWGGSAGQRRRGEEGSQSCPCPGPLPRAPHTSRRHRTRSKVEQGPLSPWPGVTSAHSQPRRHPSGLAQCSQDTSSVTVLSALTEALRKVTRQVRLVP